jgi:hypothetical protein
MMTTAESAVVEISRHYSVNGYVYEYEYDESLTSVKEVQRAHQQRVNWWLAKLDPEASRIPRAA